MSLRTNEYTDAFVKNMMNSLTGLEVDTDICNLKYNDKVLCIAADGGDEAAVILNILPSPIVKGSRTFLSGFKVDPKKDALLQAITIKDTNGVIEDTLDDLLTQNFPTLYTFDIRAKGTIGNLPEVANVKKLRHLTIHGSLTGGVPEAYESVEYMDLAGNQLTAFDDSKFLGLALVNLSGNTIAEFNNFFDNIGLSKKYITVDISENKGLKEFPTYFNTPYLKFLNVSGCDFYGEVPTKLPEFLEVLDVSNNKLTGSLMISLLAEIINASHNTFTALHYDNSELMPKIKRLDLSSNPNLECSLSIGKKATPSLNVLNVSNIKSVQFTDLREGVALPRFPSTLRVLDLTNAGLKGRIPEDAFEGCNQLERVELGGNYFKGCIPASWNDNAVLKAANLRNTMKYCGANNGKTIGIAVGCSLGGVLLLVLLLVVLCCCYRSCCLTQCLIRFWNKVCCCCRCGVTEEDSNVRYALDGEYKSRESLDENITNSSLTSADFAGLFVNDNEGTDNNDTLYSIS